MANNISQWFTTDASNNTGSAPNFPVEGQSASSVNDTMRTIYGANARWYQDTSGSLVTSGSGNAYTLTTNNAHAALGGISALAFRVDRANTGAVTLNVDGLGAKSWKNGGNEFPSGGLTADQVVWVLYNATNDEFDTIGGLDVALLGAANTFVGAVTFAGTPVIDGGGGASLRFVESDAGLDEKNWRWRAGGDRMTLLTETDAFAASDYPIDIFRTAAAVDEIELNATTIDLNGVVDISSRLQCIISGTPNIILRDTSSSNSARIDLTEGSAGFGVSGSAGVRFVYNSTANTFYLQGGNGSTVSNILTADRDGAEVDITATTLDFNATTVEISGGLDTPASSASEVGFRGAPSRDVSSSTTTAADDMGRVIRLTGGSGQTFTLDSDPPEDATVLIDNASGNSWSIAASGTLIWAATGGTGSRTLADDGMAAALHRGSGVWVINGGGLV